LAFLVAITVLAGAFLFLQRGVLPALAETIDVEIDAKIIRHFQIGKPEKTQFGGLRYSSGIEFDSDDDNLGGISGIRILDGGASFLSVSDKGMWFTGTIDRDSEGRITGISNARIAALLDKKGHPIRSKKRGDSEGMDIFGDRVLVSFERKSRIYNYPLDLEKLASKPKSFRPSIKKIKLPNNSGLEAITVLDEPGSAKLSNADIAVFSEHSLDKNGNIRGFVSKNKKWKKFAVKAIGGYKITDATLLPDGDILILERQFSLTTGGLIRIRQIAVREIKPGALLDGKILLEADSWFQIDNLEGISAWVNESGQTMVTIVSDNNFSSFQRNLMLEFELVPGKN
jgi:hypothetical protein